MAVRPLRPATDRRFGRPLPCQLANQTRVHLTPSRLFHTKTCVFVRLCGITSSFPLLSPCVRQVAHALLTRPPLSYLTSISEKTSIKYFVRLACVKHAASVHPEPGSNSLNKVFLFPQCLKTSFPSFRLSVSKQQSLSAINELAFLLLSFFESSLLFGSSLLLFLGCSLLFF